MPNDMQSDLAGLQNALLNTDNVEQFLHELVVHTTNMVADGPSLASRAVIDQAVGVIMATEHCPQVRAFALLRGVSQNTNVKLRDLAADIVTNVSGEPPRPTSTFEDD